MNIAEARFRSKVVTLMQRLIAAFALSPVDAAAIAGNLGHESRGFTAMQEEAPTVKGSKGGYGWAQWTGPRRRAFEAWCSKSGLDAASDEANIGFLVEELKTSEAGAIPAVKNSAGLENKVKAFEAHFERAGVKHYESRIQWANVALDEWNHRCPGTSAPAAKPSAPAAPPAIPGLDKPMTLSTTNISTVAGASTGVVSAFAGLDWRVAVPIVLVIGLCAVVVIWQRMKYAKAAREAGV